MFLDIKINLIENEVQIENKDKQDVCQMINLCISKNINLETFKTHIEVKNLKNNSIFQFDYPETHLKISTTNLDIIQTYNYYFTPDVNHEIKVKYSYLNENYEEVFNFTGNRPKKPYESWIWDGFNWAAPLPYPVANANQDILSNEIYTWNEETISWEPIGGYSVE
jgi:hypothetical protein